MKARDPENVAVVQRVRANVDNFNAKWPAALAEIYAAFPNELMEWQARVTALTSSMSEDDAQKYRDEIIELARKTGARPPRVISWRQRLWRWVQSMF